MKTKLMFYGVLLLVVGGSFSFTNMESTKVADALTIAPTNVASDELRPPAEVREEGYEATEAAIEFKLP